MYKCTNMQSTASENGFIKIFLGKTKPVQALIIYIQKKKKKPTQQ